jgi:uncharacterized protein (TIGR00251 family)
VKLTPRGRRDAIDGWIKDADGVRLLKVRVTAAPEDGKANRALIRLLADALGVAQASIRIASGETSRNKLIEIAGEAPIIAARLDALGDVE